MSLAKEILDRLLHEECIDQEDHYDLTIIFEELEARAEKAERERDAAVSDFSLMCTSNMAPCAVCKTKRAFLQLPEDECEGCGFPTWFEKWQWRGMEEHNDQD